jgi:hypothetical protein
MARNEHDREGLLREATALVERVSVRLAETGAEVVVGFRRDGSASFFFGSEPVYQLTSKGTLRRAYWRGLLYKAHRGQLVALRRRRADAAIELLSHELSAAEASEFRIAMQQHLQSLQTALNTEMFALVGQVPAEADVVGRVRRWLGSLADNVEIADSPRAQ